MGLRVDGRENKRRRAALRRLWGAGEDGLAALVAEDSNLDIAVLLTHGLAEAFTDPTRLAMVADRYRLTPAGRQLCRQLFGRPAFFHQPRRQHEETATRDLAD